MCIRDSSKAFRHILPCIAPVCEGMHYHKTWVPWQMKSTFIIVLFLLVLPRNALFFEGFRVSCSLLWNYRLCQIRAEPVSYTHLYIQIYWQDSRRRFFLLPCAQMIPAKSYQNTSWSDHIYPENSEDVYKRQEKRFWTIKKRKTLSFWTWRCRVSMVFMSGIH